jgi:hypothetical protein
MNTNLNGYKGVRRGKGICSCVFCHLKGISFFTATYMDLLEHDMIVHGLPRHQKYSDRQKLIDQIENKKIDDYGGM